LVTTRRRPLVASARRKTLWLASADIDAVTSLAPSTAVLHQSFTGAGLDQVVPFTVVRTRGIITVRTDQIVSNEDWFGAYGFCIVTEQARAAGVVSIPTPITEETSDVWFVHGFYAGAVTVGSGTAFQELSRVFEFDSKAMRTVEEGEAIAVVVENASASAGIAFTLKFRMLIKLH